MSCCSIQLTFGSGDEPVVTYRFALKPKEQERSRKKEEEEEEAEESEEDEEDEEDEDGRKKLAIQYDEVRVLYLDDSCRERWRRGVAHGLNLLELSGYVV